MSRIGTYYLPDISISKAMNITKMVYKHNISSDDGLATRIGHSTTNSGAFIRKLVTLRKLGIIRSGVKGIELTALGEKIAKPLGNQEQQQAYKELITQVPLFLDLRKKLKGKSPDKDSFLATLIDVTGVERSVADRESLKIQKLYNDALKYTTPALDVPSVGGEQMFSESEVMQLKLGGINITAPIDINSLEYAIQSLKTRKEELERQAKKK